jgi:hypothetical protein
MNPRFLITFVEALRGTELDDFRLSAHRAQNLALLLNEAKHATWAISPEERARLERTEKKVDQLCEYYHTYTSMSKRCLQLIMSKIREPGFQSGLSRLEIAGLQQKLTTMERMPRAEAVFARVRPKTLQAMNVLAMEITHELNSFLVHKNVEGLVQEQIAHARISGHPLSAPEITRLRAEVSKQLKADDEAAPMGSSVHQVVHDVRTGPESKPPSGTFPHLTALLDRIKDTVEKLTEPSHDDPYFMAMGRYLGVAQANDGSNLFDEVKAIGDASDHRDYAYAEGAMHLMLHFALNAHTIEEKIHSMVFNPPAPPPPDKGPKK